MTLTILFETQNKIVVKKLLHEICSYTFSKTVVYVDGVDQNC